MNLGSVFLCLQFVWIGSCSQSKSDANDGYALVADISIQANHDVDILFVVDNSGGMAEEQASLTANFDRFINALEEDELPNLHIGVVSTDLGAGPSDIEGCADNGDDGRLQTTEGISCSPPTDALLVDVAEGAERQLDLPKSDNYIAPFLG